MKSTDAENETSILDIQLKSRWNEIIAAELILLLCVLVIAVLGNGIIFMAFCKSAKFQTTQNMYIMSLAVVDILMTVLVAPLTMVVVVKGDWAFSEVVCQFQGFIIAGLVTVTILTVTIIAVDRCFAMVYPDKYANVMTQYAVTGIIATGWFLAILVPSSYFLDGQKFTFHPGYLFCKPSVEGINYIFASIIAIIYFLVPLTIVFTSYLEIWRRIEIRREKLKKAQDLTNKSRKKWDKDEKATRLFGATTLAVLCLWVPISLVEIIETFCGPYIMPRSLYVICSLLGFAAFAVKIFVYSRFNKELKNEFLQTVKCRTSRRIADISHSEANLETSSVQHTQIKTVTNLDSDKQFDTEEEDDEDELQFDIRTPTPYGYESSSLAKRSKSRIDSGHYSEARTLPSTPFEARPDSVLSHPKREKIRKENVRFCENQVFSYPSTETGPIVHHVRKSNLPQRKGSPPQKGSQVHKPSLLQGESTSPQTGSIVSQTQVSTPSEENNTPPQTESNILQTRMTTSPQRKSTSPQMDVAFSQTEPRLPQVGTSDQTSRKLSQPEDGTTPSQTVPLPPLSEPVTKTAQNLQDMNGGDIKDKATESPPSVPNVGSLLKPIPSRKNGVKPNNNFWNLESRGRLTPIEHLRKNNSRGGVRS